MRKGRTFHRGKSVEKYMRSLIIDDILSGGGNVSTEYFPGSFRAIGSKSVQSKRCYSFKRIMRSAGDFFYRSRYNGLQIEVRRDNDKPEKVNISTLSWIAAVAPMNIV